MSGLVDVGSANFVLIARVIAITDAKLACLQEQVAEARLKGHLLDLTCGRPARSVLVTDGNCLILSSLRAKTLASRLEQRMLSQVVLEL